MQGKNPQPTVCSVFTDDDTTNMPKLAGPPKTDMDQIKITESGIYN